PLPTWRRPMLLMAVQSSAPLSAFNAPYAGPSGPLNVTSCAVPASLSVFRSPFQSMGLPAVVTRTPVPLMRTKPPPAASASNSSFDRAVPSQCRVAAVVPRLDGTLLRGAYQPGRYGQVVEEPRSRGRLPSLSGPVTWPEIGPTTLREKSRTGTPLAFSNPSTW